MLVDFQITMTKSYLQALPKRWHACTELHFALSRFTLSFETGASSAPVMARINTDDYTTWCGMVAYQLDFSRRLTVFFDDRTTKRANERVSAPWSAPLAALRGVRFQQPRLSLAACRRDGNGASSAFSTLERNTRLTIEAYQRLSYLCRVRYFASSAEGRDPGDSLRKEATGAEGVKRLFSHSSEFNREYVITVRWHRTVQLGALFLSPSIFLCSEVARSRLPFIQPVERYTSLLESISWNIMICKINRDFWTILKII